MKKLILAIVLFSMSVSGTAFACLEFYYDKDGQMHDINCKNARTSPDIKCRNKGNFYWNGKNCQEIEVIKNCENSRGTWRQVQLYPKPVFKNTCVCRKGFWNGKKCVTNVTPEIRHNLHRVWCDSLRKKIDVYIPSEIMKR